MKNHSTMKELPDSEKPYEKCRTYGAQALSDAELLAVIIRAGANGISSVELATEVLNYNQGYLLNLYQMTYQELLQIHGIGTVKAIQLKCMAELSRRLAKATRYDKLHLSNAASVAFYYMEQLRHETRENLLMSMYDAKCALIGEEIISVGTVNASLVSPREVFITALNRRAVHIILLHNHPSGYPAPSREDKLVTQKIKECGDLLGIHLADHIIIGDNQYYSFKEKGLIP